MPEPIDPNNGEYLQARGPNLESAEFCGESTKEDFKKAVTGITGSIEDGTLTLDENDDDWKTIDLGNGTTVLVGTDGTDIDLGHGGREFFVTATEEVPSAEGRGMKITTEFTLAPNGKFTKQIIVEDPREEFERDAEESQRYREKHIMGDEAHREKVENMFSDLVASARAYKETPQFEEDMHQQALNTNGEDVVEEEARAVIAFLEELKK